MALQVTRWYPDTCDCIIDYQWDDTEPEAARTHTLKAVVKQCAAHSKIPDDKQHFSTVLEENQRKNKAMAQASLLKADLDVQGIQWSFDQGRVLHIVFGAHLSDIDKASIQGWCESTFGGSPSLSRGIRHLDPKWRAERSCHLFGRRLRQVFPVRSPAREAGTPSSPLVLGPYPAPADIRLTHPDVAESGR